ncbi:MAG TPA: hypothetical protein VFW10_20005 [Steroidobacteraceae bacterium]|nr:hypothetical protein [Steroidobacteraceae bacterium]
MTDDELDTLYGELCRSLTRVGEARAHLLLARFALLAMGAIDDPPRIRALLAAAHGCDTSGTSDQPPVTSDPVRGRP